MSGALRGSVKKISYPETHFDNDAVDFHRPPKSFATIVLDAEAVSDFGISVMGAHPTRTIYG